MTHKSLYIVDNSTDVNSVKSYLSQWCSISKQIDIAAGYFEIGGLLCLDQDWQKLDKIRIILGSETTKRTKEMIEESVSAIIEHFRQTNSDGRCSYKGQKGYCLYRISFNSYVYIP